MRTKIQPVNTDTSAQIAKVLGVPAVELLEDVPDEEA
jgi:hypothetical protein